MGLFGVRAGRFFLDTLGCLVHNDLNETNGGREMNDSAKITIQIGDVYISHERTGDGRNLHTTIRFEGRLGAFWQYNSTEFMPQSGVSMPATSQEARFEALQALVAVEHDESCDLTTICAQIFDGLSREDVRTAARRCKQRSAVR